jgi:hypothetical protein
MILRKTRDSKTGNRKTGNRKTDGRKTGRQATGRQATGGSRMNIPDKHYVVNIPNLIMSSLILHDKMTRLSYGAQISVLLLVI